MELIISMVPDLRIRLVPFKNANADYVSVRVLVCDDAAAPKILQKPSALLFDTEI